LLTAPLQSDAAKVALLCGDNMAKRTARTITRSSLNRSSQKVSKTSFKAIKKQAKARAARKEFDKKGSGQRPNAEGT
jgi:hypothetical protein